MHLTGRAIGQVLQRIFTIFTIFKSTSPKVNHHSQDDEMIMMMMMMMVRIIIIMFRLSVVVRVIYNQIMTPKYFKKIQKTKRRKRREMRDERR